MPEPGVPVERIPILKMGSYLLVTIQVDMHDRLATTLQDDLTAGIARSGARGVLIDISSLDVVDSFIGRMLGNLAAMARVLDAEEQGERPEEVDELDGDEEMPQRDRAIEAPGSERDPVVANEHGAPPFQRS